ncbi:fatty-acid--CoA ligase FadD5 [Actinomycetospora corticicola]|uniref:Acyl-CoA synthetase (AMP-forming)/AMP-acid ligase II n=1 Tax=Actinomycetospora corticicola TaxID=663602 RepID=A0A7Y9DY72_9PSEU|nr:long-chain-fatty-acid--CoA ligase [Actinomycetospora corticicola]NYD37565.1 acyl-CoA synthetase (AMP-forming)/AMP-acid ligase II [Actinomycetospora corticicola]
MTGAVGPAGSITGRGMTMSDLVARDARLEPDRTAFVDVRSRRSYREVDDRVTRLGNALASRGVAPGDRLAVLGLNSTDVVEAWLAALRIGAIAVPVNFRMVADEVAYVLADSGARVVLCDEAFVPVVDDARRAAPEVVDVLTLGAGLDAVLAEATGTSTERPVEDEAAAFIMYTSGTTGSPKGAVLTHRNLYLHAFCSMATLGREGDDLVWMSAAPLFHIAGLSGMLPALITAGTTVIPPSGGFDPAATVATLANERVTSCFMVPAQWQAVCALPDLATFDLSRLRRISWGAAPASDTLLRTMIESFPQAEVCTAFGQTECSPVTTYLRGEDSIRKIGSIGTPMVGVEVRVVDDEMNDVPRGAVGEIVYRSPMVMTGYWNKPDETAEAFRGAWFHSGDLVREDEDGYLYVVDRLKDMIISGGENIYCAEVENVLAAHPKIAEVALIGVPDPRWGETPLAVVVPRAPHDAPTDAEVEAFAREHLAAYKRPRHVRYVDALPRNAGGKVVKKALRERFGRDDQR